MKVGELNVSEKIKEILRERGIEELYPPQAEALTSGVLEGENLLVAIPTASGKTLIAEIAIANKLLEEGGKAVYIVPLKALAEEKFREFKDWERLGLKVAMATGDYDSKDEWLGKYDIIIATAEKFDSLLRHGSSWIRDVKMLVIDEIHLIGSRDRGATLEFIITQMLGRAQIIGLSATIGNPEELAEWLNAKLIRSDWRPVKLRKGVFYQGFVFWEDGGSERYNSWEELVYDAVKKGKGALVFVNMRRKAEKTALELAKKVKNYLDRKELRELRELAESLEENPTNEKLAKALLSGVAFHHAGLGRDERVLVEDNFRKGLIKVVVATPTLSAGINTPAFRVIIRDTWRYSEFGMERIPVLEVQQMMGRAGRPRYDEVGEAIIVSTTEEPSLVIDHYIKGKPEKLFSQLSNESILRSQILALIATFGYSEFKEIYDFLERTFYAHQGKDPYMLEEKIRRIIYFLLENEFIEVTLEDEIKPLPLGVRTTKLYIDPMTAKIFKDTLPRIEKNPNPLGIFHMISLAPDLTPLSYSKRETSMLEDEYYSLMDRLYFELDYENERKFFRAFKTALVLNAWINEVPEGEIVERFNVEPGDIYRIVETAEWLIYSLGEIAKVLEASQEVVDYVNTLRLRVKHGIREELIPLMELPMVGRKRARALYNAGFKDLESIRNAKPSELLRIEGIGAKIVEGIFKYLGKEVKITERPRKGTLDYFLNP
ncbi:ATP-dependent DNA helicase [Pyrococcus abyssi]|uniref:ATP-dependent DNA helicase Hel308 n=1 Tax=Pyrococcus abyssi (strain GE5 / Orsay) TaxID=272844 RepID=HELS_PYRAB|nr:ATP-dependent DNA helicase [Pyrococcus abyssi]Q9V0A9.1 RecName: Full=ATP-dependent DNA helicase Hel308; AltName: Full=DNA 3'-5' helicase Hel308 [Pyrococcus abyssi GE5]CAB49795.1 DNA helicase [Pyrococcus abyssi GE5]CCE70287.1 TPA: ski2-like helicase [Pyrococcus abyssi GE5]